MGNNISELHGELTLMSKEKRAVSSNWYINESLSYNCTAFIWQTLIISVLCVRVEFNYQGLFVIVYVRRHPAATRVCQLMYTLVAGQR